MWEELGHYNFLYVPVVLLISNYATGVYFGVTILIPMTHTPQTCPGKYLQEARLSTSNIIH